MRLAGWILRKDRRWVSSEGMDVTRFIWGQSKQFWDWLETAPIFSKNFAPKKVEITGLVTSDQARKEFIERTNLYRVRMVIKLYKLAKKKDEMKFKRLAKTLSKHSKAFRIWLMEDIKIDWVNKPHKMRKAHMEYQKIIYEGTAWFKFHRKWIPKADGSLRPLSVPTASSRMLAKWMTELAGIWLEANPAFDERQFGSIRGKSVADAWNYILKEMLPKRFIAEFDIAKCYDTLQWSHIPLRLKADLPEFIANYAMKVIKYAQYSIPEKEYEREIEALWQWEFTKLDKLWSEFEPWDTRIVNKIKEFFSESKEEHIEKRKKEWQWIKSIETTADIDRVFNRGLKPREWPDLDLSDESRARYAIDEMIYEMFPKKERNPLSFWDEGIEDVQVWDFGMGIPQGWAMSPMVLNLTIRNAMPKRETWAMYLDDGVIATDSWDPQMWKDMIGDFHIRGLHLHPGKFKWQKVYGFWVEECWKFLGIQLNRDGSIQGNTKTGSTAMMTREGLTELTNTKSGSKVHYPMTVVDIVKDTLLTDTQVAWMHNKGGFFGSNGDWIPVSMSSLWARTWNSRKMKAWRRANPELASAKAKLYLSGKAEKPSDEI